MDYFGRMAHLDARRVRKVPLKELLGNLIPYKKPFRCFPLNDASSLRNPSPTESCAKIWSSFIIYVIMLLLCL